MVGTALAQSNIREIVVKPFSKQADELEIKLEIVRRLVEHPAGVVRLTSNVRNEPKADVRMMALSPSGSEADMKPQVATGRTIINPDITLMIAAND